MSLSSFLVLCSLLWLLYRALQLWSTPLNVILRHLQIDLPSPPRITIDALSAESVSLHWAPPDSHVKKHIIQMDGQDVGISVRGETSVTISGLTAEYLYSIQVIAVNAQGFQVASSVVYIRTRPRTEEEEEEAEDSHEPIVLAHTTPTAEIISASHRMPRRKHSLETQKPKEALSYSQPEETARPASKTLIFELTAKMEAIRKECNEVDAQMAQLTENQATEEGSFAKKLEGLRLKKREEDDVRIAKDHHHKQLDQQKRELEMKRNHIQKALKAVQEEHRKQNTDIASFQSSIKNSIETTEHLRESMKTLKVDTDEAVQDAERTGSIAAEELSEIESEIRYLLSRKAESENELTRLLSESRVASPTSQERLEEEQANSLWKEREEFLVKQYEEVQANLVRLQGSTYHSGEQRNGTPNSDLGLEYNGQIRRRISRHGKPTELSRTDLNRTSAVPAFNPDAAPFVAGPAYHEQNVATNPLTRNIFPIKDTYNSTNSTYKHHTEPLTYSLAPSIPYATTSIFNNESQPTRNTSPFVRRDSPISSQSSSEISSPGIQPRPRTSIFDSTSIQPVRNASNSLVSSLNGTPLNELEEDLVEGEKSRWSWRSKKKKAADPLALDRKNTRSLPKADVAPIGTRRRSGSLREENNFSAKTASNVLNAYNDLDLQNVMNGGFGSNERDSSLVSTQPLPRPSHGGAFGWRSSSTTNAAPALAQRSVPNPWSAADKDVLPPTRGFDPFADLPNIITPASNYTSNTTDPAAQTAHAAYKDHTAHKDHIHTIISTSRINGSFEPRSHDPKNLDSSDATVSRQHSAASTKPESTKRFGSFVGRVFSGSGGTSSGGGGNPTNNDTSGTNMDDQDG